MKQNKVNTFIVGAPKCGTTSFAEYLKTHPDIFVPKIKEPHYFANDFNDLRVFDNLEEYEKQYQSRKATYYLDASVWYLYSAVALKNIRSYNPEAKIIVMLRNPSEMVVSLHAQLLYTLDENVAEFERAWKLQGERKKGQNIPPSCREPRFLQYKEVASYSEQIVNLFDLFPKKQIKIILFDDLVREPDKIYVNVLNFLGLPHDRRKEFPKINSRKKNKSILLAKLIHRPPKLFSLLARLVKPILGKEQLNLLNRLDMANRSEMEKQQLSNELKNELQVSFLPEVKKLETLLKKDLTIWN